MSNLGQYSPFKRSYQFMHLQNSAYHSKNKLNVKPLVKTNLKRTNRSYSENKSKTTSKQHRYSLSEIHPIQPLKINLSRDFSGEFHEPHRIIHMNQITERAKSARINRQNVKMVQRLIDAQCLVTDKIQAETFYNKHQKYRNLRRRYQQNGERVVIPLGNMKLLNPTLVSFRTSHHNTSKAAVNVEDTL